MGGHQLSLPTRRDVLSAAGASVLAAWMAPELLAEEGAASRETGPVQMIRGAAAKEPISVVNLRGNLSVIQGSGGNIAVLNGQDGKLLVDAGIPASKSKIGEALDKIGPAPIRYLVNTHWHFDHTDGNDWIHAAGATIVAHVNTRKRLSSPTRVAGWRFTFPARSPGALPTLLFKPHMTLFINDTRIALDYYESAHTDSDICVHFADADVMHVGDTFWNGFYPFIDYSTGGSIDGQIEAAEVNLAKASPSTIIIPGHGPVGNRQELAEFRDMLVDVRDRVTTLKKQGRSLNETVAAKPTAAYDAKWGGFAVDGPTFTELVYAGV